MSARERLVWVTAAGQRVDHAVTADDLAAGIGADGKEIVALCGRRFVARQRAGLSPRRAVAETAPECSPRDSRDR